jgi:hypothetical protein
MRSKYEEKPGQRGPEAKSGKTAAIFIVVLITALFVALLRYLAGL